MRNLKKILALVLALVMSLSLMATAGAADTTASGETITPAYQTAIDVLKGVEVFRGYEDGTIRPQSYITRAEVAAILYRIATGDVNDTKKDIYTDMANTKFTDLANATWAAGYINYCANAELIVGMGDGTFKPQQNITGYATLAMVLRALGYDKNNEFKGSGWEIRTASKARELGVLKNVTTDELGSYATRELVSELLFRTILNETVTYSPINQDGYRKTGKTLAEQTLGLYEQKGVVMANEYAHLEDNETLDDGETLLVNETRSLIIDQTTTLDDIGETRLAYIQDFNPNDTTPGKVLAMDGTGLNNAKDTVEKMQLSALLKEAGLKATDEKFINFAKTGLCTSEYKIKYVLKFDTAADADAAMVEIKTETNGIVEKDSAVAVAVTLKPGTVITSADRGYIKGIFSGADRFEDLGYINGEVYVGTQSLEDISDDYAYSYSKFEDQFLIFTEEAAFTANEAGNWMKVIDNDLDGTADYIFKVVYTVAQVAREKDGTVTLDTKNHVLRLDDKICGNDEMNNLTTEAVHANDFTPAKGDVVYYAIIDGKAQTYKCEEVSTTIEKVDHNKLIATTTDGAEYPQSGVHEHIEDEAYESGVKQLAGKINYTLFLDRGSNLAAFVKAEPAGDFKLILDGWYNRLKANKEFAVRYYDDETGKQVLSDDIGTNASLFIIDGIDPLIQNNNWGALKWFGGSLTGLSTEKGDLNGDGDKVHTTVAAITADGTILPVENSSVTGRYDHAMIDLMIDGKNAAVPTRVAVTGQPYYTAEGRNTQTAYDTMGRRVYNKNTYDYTIETGTVEVRALTSTVYYVVYPDDTMPSGYGVIKSEGYANAPTLSNYSDSVRGSWVEDVYAVGTLHEADNGLTTSKTYYNADIVVVELNYYNETGKVVFVTNDNARYSDVRYRDVTYIDTDGSVKVAKVDWHSYTNGYTDNQDRGKQVQPGLYRMYNTVDDEIKTLSKMSREEIAACANVAVGQIDLSQWQKDADYIVTENWTTDTMNANIPNGLNNLTIDKGAPVGEVSYDAAAVNAYTTEGQYGVAEAKLYKVAYGNTWRDNYNLSEDDETAIYGRVNEVYTRKLDREDGVKLNNSNNNTLWFNYNDVLVYHNTKGAAVYVVSFENFQGDTAYVDNAQKIWESIVPAGNGTIVNPPSDVAHKITVTYGENGTAVADLAEAKKNTVVTITATANEGYELDTITMNGTAITGNTFVMPDADVTVHVTFKAKGTVTPTELTVTAKFGQGSEEEAFNEKLLAGEGTLSEDGKTLVLNPDVDYSTKMSIPEMPTVLYSLKLTANGVDCAQYLDAETKQYKIPVAEGTTAIELVYTYTFTINNENTGKPPVDGGFSRAVIQTLAVNDTATYYLVTAKGWVPVVTNAAELKNFTAPVIVPEADIPESITKNLLAKWNEENAEEWGEGVVWSCTFGVTGGKIPVKPYDAVNFETAKLEAVAAIKAAAKEAANATGTAKWEEIRTTAQEAIDLIKGMTITGTQLSELNQQLNGTLNELKKYAPDSTVGTHIVDIPTVNQLNGYIVLNYTTDAASDKLTNEQILEMVNKNTDGLVASEVVAYYWAMVDPDTGRVAANDPTQAPNVAIIRATVNGESDKYLVNLNRMYDIKVNGVHAAYMPAFTKTWVSQDFPLDSDISRWAIRYQTTLNGVEEGNYLLEDVLATNDLTFADPSLAGANVIMDPYYTDAAHASANAANVLSFTNGTWQWVTTAPGVTVRQVDLNTLPLAAKVKAVPDYRADVTGQTYKPEFSYGDQNFVTAYQVDAAQNITVSATMNGKRSESFVNNAGTLTVFAQRTADINARMGKMAADGYIAYTIADEDTPIAGTTVSTANAAQDLNSIEFVKKDAQPSTYSYKGLKTNISIGLVTDTLVKVNGKNVGVYTGNNETVEIPAGVAAKGDVFVPYYSFKDATGAAVESATVANPSTYNVAENAGKLEITGINCNAATTGIANDKYVVELVPATTLNTVANPDEANFASITLAYKDIKSLNVNDGATVCVCNKVNDIAAGSTLTFTMKDMTAKDGIKVSYQAPGATSATVLGVFPADTTNKQVSYKFDQIGGAYTVEAVKVVESFKFMDVSALKDLKDWVSGDLSDVFDQADANSPLAAMSFSKLNVYTLVPTTMEVVLKKGYTDKSVDPTIAQVLANAKNAYVSAGEVVELAMEIDAAAGFAFNTAEGVVTAQFPSNNPGGMRLAPETTVTTDGESVTLTIRYVVTGNGGTTGGDDGNTGSDNENYSTPDEALEYISEQAGDYPLSYKGVKNIWEQAQAALGGMSEDDPNWERTANYWNKAMQQELDKAKKSLPDVPSENGDYIFVGDVELDERVDFTSEGTTTYDLDGHKMDVTADWALVIYNDDATLVLKNGFIDSMSEKKGAGLISVNKGSLELENMVLNGNGKSGDWSTTNETGSTYSSVVLGNETTSNNHITITGSRLYGNGFAINTHGESTGTIEMNLEDSTFEGKFCGALFSGDCDVTATGCTFVGGDESGILARVGDIKLENCTLTGASKANRLLAGYDTNYDLGLGGSTVYGAGLGVMNNGNCATKGLTVTVTGTQSIIEGEYSVYAVLANTLSNPTADITVTVGPEVMLDGETGMGVDSVVVLAQNTTTTAKFEVKVGETVIPVEAIEP